MTNSLRIHLFGPFEVSLDGTHLTNHDWHTQQTQSIAKILLSHRGKVVTSDQLIDSLWPDDPVDTARRRLHVRINQLRKCLRDKSSLVRTVHNGYAKIIVVIVTIFNRSFIYWKACINRQHNPGFTIIVLFQ
jgi:DNA-binding SARP family transcriptional activator